MFKKLQSKALTVNLKKGFIGLLIACIVFAVGSGIALYLNFGDRAAQAKDAREQMWEQMLDDCGADTSVDSVFSAHNKHGIGGKNSISQKWDRKGFKYSLESEWNLTTADKVMVGAVMGIAAVLGVIYWLLCMVWAYQKSNRLGINCALWVIATLFLNLWAIAGLYIYAGFKGKCKKCGHLKQKGEKYCSHCGNANEIMCGSCQTTVSADAVFCPNCGKPIYKTNAENG